MREKLVDDIPEILFQSLACNYFISFLSSVSILLHFDLVASLRSY